MVELLGIGAVVLLLLVLCWPLLFATRGTPPGPPRWPLVGSLFSLSQPLPACFASLSRKYGPVLYLKLGMLPLVVVNSPGMAKELLKTHDLDFANRPPKRFFQIASFNFSGLIFASYGEHLKSLRRLALVHMFSTAKLNASAPSRELKLRSLVCSIKRSGRELVQLREEFGEFNANIVFELLFGIKQVSSTQIAKILGALEGLTSLALNVNIGELFPALDWLDLHGVYKKMRSDLLPQMTSLLMEIVEERKRHLQGGGADQKDVLGSLLSMPDVSTATILILLVDMISAGIETSQAVTEWAMAEVMNNAEVMKKAQEEIDRVVGAGRLVQESDIEELPYVQAIVTETLRLHPPAPLGIPHYNPKESTLAGYTIPAKSQVLINIWAIGRDPAHWNDPEAFKPERFLGSDINVTGQHFELLPFSSGRRICPGYPLALRSIPMVVATLLHAFDWERHGTNSLQETNGTLSSKLASKVEARAVPRLDEAAYSAKEEVVEMSSK